ncbi:outer membrane protein [Fulvivirga imtechensis AK7]|uniref:Outer membrane protein n=1 Tax=Fulvivirga imtechensis AK7 TaxID=1237149 RepID=L8JMH7_9BACT|nr:OmpA family protein [Fulvivirga imtechensis]ELR69428.1 outer membrane protein [Fulvivirga imtechensis AK7]
MRVSAVIILLFVLLPVLSFAQSQLSTKSKKAAEYYYQADNFRVRGQYTMAAELLEKAIEKDDKFHEAYFRLATIYKAKGELNEAEKLLLHAEELTQGQNAGVSFEQGELYLLKGEYEKAITYIDRYLSFGPKNSRRIEEAKKIKADANFALENMDLAAELNPQPLSDTVNAFVMQYFPVVTVDQQSMIFTRRLGTSMADDEDLVISSKNEEGRWGKPVSLSENINSEGNEGTCTISADGRTLIFTSCYGRPGYGSCDLYISKKTGDEWSKPVNLGAKVNSSAWESQPSLSSDGRTLYFISNRGGGIGGRDIYVSRLDENNQWTTPENLGRGVNTQGDEVSPFIHPNNVTLYFASNGLTGFGGFDIFYSERENDEWSTPKNLGYPINTSEDQVSLFITSDGKKGYYSHEVNNNPKQKGRIYEFNVPESVRVKYSTSYVSGKVFHAETKEPLKADIELFDLKEAQREGLVSSDSVTGSYLMVLTEGSEYALYVNKEGYLFESLSFEYELNADLEPVNIDIYLKPIKSGARAVLNNIFFEFDSFELQQKSKTELNKLVRFLKQNTSVKMEIGGHTDNTGSEAYNMDLSLKRAKAVYDYLIAEGISKSQLTYKGYGQTTPAYPNDSDLHKKFNRRIEFRVLD